MGHKLKDLVEDQIVCYISKSGVAKKGKVYRKTVVGNGDTFVVVQNQLKLDDVEVIQNEKHIVGIG